MGALTFAEILTEGGLLGGNDSLTTRAPIALKNWLRRQAAVWPWPHVIRTVSGLSLAAQSSATVGAGSGGVTDIIHQVKKPITLYSPDFRSRLRPDIVAYDESNLGLSIAVQAGQSSYGSPTKAKVGRVFGVRGQWQIDFFPRPDRAYLMELILHVIPADPAPADIPWYPEDETMIEFVSTFIKRYDNDDDRFDAMEVVAAKVVDDRAVHGGVPGFNEDLSLDESVFK